MGIGVVAIQTSQKKEQSGPPFVSTSADNGLSVDSTSGKIVLGNNVGDPAAPAQLLTDREVISEDPIGNLLSLIFNAVQNLSTNTINGNGITIAGSNFAQPNLIISGGDNSTVTDQVTAGNSGTVNSTFQSGDGGTTHMVLRTGTSVGSTALFDMRSGLEIFRLFWAGAGQFTIGVTNFGTPVSCMAFMTATAQIQVGPLLKTKNAADFQISGSVTSYVLIQGQGAGTYNVDRDIDSGKLFTNSAAANLQLPNLAAANFRSGLNIRATCANAAGITITAEAGQTIRFGSLSTSVGGTLSSTDVGAFVKIIAINSATWVTETFLGAWSLT